MSKSNLTDLEQGIGSEVDHFIYRVPKRNHDAMVRLTMRFAEITRKYETLHLIFQLNSAEEPMEGITNISKTILANQDDEVWMELIIYRDNKHKDEVAAKMRNDESMGQLYQQSLELVAPGTGFIMGGFSRLKI